MLDRRDLLKRLGIAGLAIPAGLIAERTLVPQLEAKAPLTTIARRTRFDRGVTQNTYEMPEQMYLVRADIMDEYGNVVCQMFSPTFARSRIFSVRLHTTAIANTPYRRKGDAE